MAALAPPVQVVASGAPPFVHVPSGAPPFVAVSGNAPPITIVASGAPPITLLNEDGSIWTGGAAAVGGAALLTSETDGFATDFTHPVDAERVAVKTAGTGVASGLSFFTNAGTSSKWVYNSAGLLTSVAAGSLAVDYDPVTHVARGLLSEPAATNLNLRSQELDNAAWAKSGSTVGANATTDPAGTSTADALIPSSGSNAVQFLNNAAITVVNATVYTYSMFGKNGSLGNNWVELAPTTAATARVWFNLATGAKGTSSGSPIDYTIMSAWGYRIDVTFSTGNTAFTSYNAAVSADGSNAAITGNGTSPALYLWGMQLEAGTVATSPIPTVAASVTRAADNINFLLSAIPALGSEYSIYCRFSTPVIANGKHVVVLTDGTLNEFAGIAANTTVQLAVVDGGVAVGAITGPTLVANTTVSVAARFKANDCAMSVGGGAVVKDTTVTLPTVTQVRFGGDGSNAAATAIFRIEKLVIVPRGWSDAELAAKSAA